MNEDNKSLTERRLLPTYMQYPDLSPADEISLIDLWLILFRHKRLITAILGVAIILGGIVALNKTPRYTYTTTIQIARSADSLLEQPGTLLAKLNESYIPYVLQQAFTTEPDAKKFKIEAKIPKDSNIIVMESEGAELDQEHHFKMHTQVLDKLAQDQDPEIDVVKLTMGSELNRIRNRLDKLKDEALLSHAQGKRLDEQEALFKDQLKDIQKLIDSSESNRGKAIKEVEGEAKAMTLMLIDNETQKYQDRAGEIKERLLVGLSADRDTLKNELADNLRGQTELQEKLQEVQAKIVNIRYTRPIIPTMRSLEPKGSGRAAIMVLAGILGLIAGVIAAFLAEFLTRAREKINEQRTGAISKQN